MKGKPIGLMVAALVMAGSVTGWAQTNLTVVRHSDSTIWAMTCNGISNCSAWTQITGGFSVQPTLTWDPALNRYILISIGNNQTSIWRSTFNADGTWNNDWTKITGTSPSPVAVSSGSYLGNGSITGAKLAAGAVTPDKLAFYGKVAVVAMSGGNYNNPATAMTDFNTWCRSAGDNTTPCLLKIMPGTYNVGTSAVEMQPYVDIEGSGENITKITGYIQQGLVNGVSNAELRFLTVENTGGSVDLSVAIEANNTSPKITHVTAIASGGISGNIGVNNVFSSSTIMTNVTAIASGGVYSHGVVNNSIDESHQCTTIMENVSASASGATNTNNGVLNVNGASPWMRNVTATATGGTNNNGVHNSDGSSPLMDHVRASASGGSGTNSGVLNNASYPEMKYVQADATGGQNSNGIFNFNCPSSGSQLLIIHYATAHAANASFAAGIRNVSSSPTIRYTVAVGNGNSSSNVSNVVFNDSSSPHLEHVSSIARTPCASCFGVYSINSGNIAINNSSLSPYGGTGLYNGNNVTTRIGNTQINGSVTNSGDLKCVGAYNSNYDPLGTNCL